MSAKITVSKNGTKVVLKITGTPGHFNTWNCEFERNACNEFHADLEARAFTEALDSYRKEAAREVLVYLRRQKLPGVKRGRLARELDNVAQYFT